MRLCLGSLAVVLAVLVIVFALPEGAAADASLERTTTAATIETEPTEMRALVVFVQFRDDDYDEPGMAARGWPLTRDPRQLPRFANDLLAPDYASMAASEASLSRYFYDQSRHSADQPGRFLLLGDILPRNSAGEPIVYITERPNAYYHRENGRGYGHLVQEVLDNIFIGGGVDPADYDVNNDGVLDHLFMIVRTERRHTARGGDVSYSGSSHLGGYGSLGGTPSQAPEYWSVSRQENVRVDWRLSGSFLITHTQGNIVSDKYHVNLMAHELGHDLWRNHIRSAHLAPVTRNAVPANEPENPRARDYRYGYALMPGAPYTNGRGLLTISAHERSLLGWISLDTLGGSSRTIDVGDLYSTADAFILPLPQPGHRLYLTNHQRIGYFDRVHTNPHYTHNPPYDRVASGLETTGLLATFSTAPSNLQVLPANNHMELATWFLPEESPYEGNLFGPESSTQLTPWTRPNINGCNGYSAAPLCAGDDFRVSWAAIDDIRYTGRDDLTMRFDYVEDFRSRPVIRADSWIEPGIDGVIPGDMLVTDGSTLRIVSGAEVRFEGRLTIDPGAEVVVEQGADVIFGPVDVRTGGRLTRL